MSSASDASQQPEWMQRKERGSLFWLRVMCAVSLFFGRRLTRPAVHGIALYFLLAVPKARAASRQYLNKVLGRPASWRDLYKHVFTFASSIHDRLYLLNDRFDMFELNVHGHAPVHRLHCDEGRGALLFGSHLGSFEVLRAQARMGTPLRVVAAMYPHNAQHIQGVMASINPKVVLDIIPLGTMESILAMHQRMTEGTLVGILADRVLGDDECLSLSFLGETAAFPVGPFRVAAMLKQPLFFMAGLCTGNGRYDMHFDTIEDFAQPLQGTRNEQIRLLAERYVAMLEKHCRAAPYNWFNFYDFWQKPTHV